MGENFDLLGDPIPDGFGRRGRPQHIPTGENRSKVRMLLAFDWKVPAIAQALRISEPTLKKHYFRELRFADEARPVLEAELMMTTVREAFAGNASMMKQAMKLLERHDLARLGVVLPGVGKSSGAKLGKKEAARLAAQTPAPDTTMGELMRQRQALGKPN